MFQKSLPFIRLLGQQDAMNQCRPFRTILPTGNINDLLYQKQLYQERIGYRQKYSNRLRELSRTGIDLSQALQVERRVLSSTQALDSVREIIQDLSSSFPHLREVLQRVEAMTDSGIPDDTNAMVQ